MARTAQFGPAPPAGLQPLYLAFQRGRRRSLPAHVRSTATQQAAYAAGQAARTLLQAASGNADLQRAAEDLGFAYHVAHLTGERIDELLWASLLGQAYRGYDLPDRDIAMEAAHAQLVFTADRLTRLGYLNSAAIDRTNAATVLLEKHVLTESDLRLVREHLDFSRKHKSPNSVDWAYTEFATGIYHVQLPAQSADHRVEKLAQARRYMESALAVFADHHQQLSVTVIGEYAHLLVVQYEAAIEQRIAHAVLNHLDDLPVGVQTAAPSVPIMVGRTLDQNPASMGFCDVPQWLVSATRSPLDEDTAAHFADAAARVRHELAGSAHSSRAEIMHARWWLARLDWELDHTPQHLDALLATVSALQSDLDHFRFLEFALFACWEGRIRLGRAAPEPMLTAIVEAYLWTLEHLPSTRAQQIVHTYAHQIRFVTCALADQAVWADALRVLEATRLRIYGRPEAEHHAAVEQNKPDDRPVLTAWVYLTHSPEATYVIVHPDGEPPAGRTVTTHNGPHLTQTVLSLRDGDLGLLSAQWTSMTGHLNDAAAHAMTDLEPLRDTILEMVEPTHNILLILDGLYAALPVTAALLDADTAPHRTIAAVPARHAVRTRPTQWDPRAGTYHLISVPCPALGQPLPRGHTETSAIANILNGTAVTVYHDLTQRQLPPAASHCQTLHFSGHSSADPVNPLESALLTHDSPFTVAHILTLDLAEVKLATLSSCQSASASVTALGSEYLGIHSAFLYAGCSFVVGTLWPVHDLTATVFMTRFYRELLSHPSADLHTVSHCVRTVQQWMKTATVRNIEQFAAHTNPPIDLPPQFSGYPNAVRPFDSPRHWAAFILTTGSL
ncbi:CHAT domain-containing protein [Mycolicibacterium fortuitum]|uniref:CHAT domain-containing protein n=1 Tax=Mycolicibacterium fortuitum TaxID=1766 RepID=UPI00148F5070|nr:CHAT domain-containing protein [Mycolicibacterium fortuitum]